MSLALSHFPLRASRLCVRRVVVVGVWGVSVLVGKCVLRSRCASFVHVVCLHLTTSCAVLQEGGEGGRVSGRRGLGRGVWAACMLW